MASRRISLDPAAFGLDPKTRLGQMQAIANAVLAEWRGAAHASGMSERFRAPYYNSLAVREVSADRAVIELAGNVKSSTDSGSSVGTLAMMAEFGMGPGGIGTQGPYDLRTFILKAGTKHLHLGKTGWYVNIPFKHSTASILERGGKEALKLAQGLRRRISDGAGNMSWDMNPKVLKNPTRLPDKLAPIGYNKIMGPEKGRHATDPLAGMVRLGSTYSKGPDGLARVQTSGYMTWRRMSASGKPWMSKGVRALRLGEKVASLVPQIVARITG